MLAVGLGLGWGSARAETFVFRDSARPPLDGRVVAEFEDVLFVALDDGVPRFLSRADLARIVGADGQAHDEPVPGTFARVQTPTPAAAVTDLVGEATLTSPGGQAAPLEATPGFVLPGGQVATGEAGLARVALLGDAVVKLGADSALGLLAGDKLELLRGEVVLESGGRPVSLTLLGLAARLGADGRVTVRADGPRATVHILTERGELDLVGAELRLHLAGGAGVEVVRTSPDMWRVSADTVNTAPIELHLTSGVELLAPGEARAFGARAAAQGEVWRLLRSSGELLLARNGADPGPVLGPDLERLALGPGDALETAVQAAQATLVRVDGATLSLYEATRLEVGLPALRLPRGRLGIEASSAPVELETPGGVSGLVMAAVLVTRTAPDELLLTATGGEPQTALSPDAQVGLEPGATGRVRALPEGRLAFQVDAGRARLTSRAGAAGFDPRFQMLIQPGPAAVIEPGAAGPTLHLPGERALRFETGGVEAEVHLREPLPEVVWKTGARALLHPGLWLGLGRSQELPQLRFKSGPRLTLALPVALEVHNPTVVFGDPATTLKLEGELEARLQDGGAFSAASLGVRERDRLELPRGSQAALERHGDTLRFSLGDQRRLWIQDGAPPVQARLGDAGGTLYLTMPGAAAMALPPGRALTVLATAEGEFVVLHGPGQDGGLIGLEPLIGDLRVNPEAISRDRFRDLLDVPPVDSPSGP